MIWASADELADRLRTVRLPDDAAAYVNGERLLVRQATKQLSASGINPEAIAAKAYWRRDQSNAAHGEPANE